MTVSQWVQPNNTTQSAAQYKANIDGGFSVLYGIAGDFAPHAVSTPNMTVQVDAGQILDGGSLVVQSMQTSGTITAPVSNPRIDRVVVDQRTGAISTVTGTENASPTAPAIPAGKLPCAQVLLQTTSTSITNSMITDERVQSSISKAYADATYATLVGLSGYATLSGNNTFSGTSKFSASYTNNLYVGPIVSPTSLNTTYFGTTTSSTSATTAGQQIALIFGWAGASAYMGCVEVDIAARDTVSGHSQFTKLMVVVYYNGTSPSVVGTYDVKDLYNTQVATFATTINGSYLEITATPASSNLTQYQIFSKTICA